jgi:O-antigen/teichoic acid export membrane protein
MLERIHKIYRTNFAKRVSTLFGANMISHIIALFNLFILARIFNLQDVGEFQVLISYVAIAGTYSLLSYQIAIQTSNDDDIAYLTLGSAVISLATSTVTILILWLVDYKYFYLVGIFTVLTSITLIIDSINIREKQTHMIGVRKVFQPVFQSVYLILCWFEVLDPTLNSLIIVSIFAILFSCFLFSSKFIKLVTQCHKDLKKVYRTMQKEFRGSGLLSISDVLNSMAYNIPTIVIEKFFGAAYAAFYATILRICNVPITLIAE